MLGPAQPCRVPSASSQAGSAPCAGSLTVWWNSCARTGVPAVSSGVSRSALSVVAVPSALGGVGELSSQLNPRQADRRRSTPVSGARRA